MGYGFDKPFGDVYNPNTGTTQKTRPLDTPLGGVNVYDVNEKGEKLTTHMPRYPRVREEVTDRYLD